MTKMAGVKQFINGKEDAVVEGLQGLCLANEHLNYLEGLPEIKVVVDQEFDGDRNVAVIAGGGAGHEPSFAGYVGKGMLSGAVVGDIFASPPSEAILALIKQVTGKKGCLVVVINYTGDRLNFGLAVEQAKSQGLKVDMIIVGDDCALPGKSLAGRRGLAGAVLVLKIAGASADKGDSLEDVKKWAETSKSSEGTLGVSTSVCTLPGGSKSDRLGKEEIEIGLGIHGEPGAKKQKIEPIDKLIKQVLKTILEYESIDESQDKVAVMVNNLGSVSELEMGIITGATLKFLTQKRSFDISRVYTGTFMTSLDMHGFSVTLLKIQDTFLSLLDAPCNAPGWKKGDSNGFKLKQPVKKKTETSTNFKRPTELTDFGQQAELCILKATNSLIENAQKLDDWDKRVGDGDCGSTVKRGALAIQEALKSRLPLNNANPLALSLADSAKNMGGTSGALYNIFFTSAASCLPEEGEAKSEEIANAMKNGVDAIKKYGGAKMGHRTMLDALEPASQAFYNSVKEGKSGKEAAQEAADQAQKGAENTQEMKAGAGRSSYIPDQEIQGIPDPGAMAVSFWIQAISQALK